MEKFLIQKFKLVKTKICEFYHSLNKKKCHPFKPRHPEAMCDLFIGIRIRKIYVPFIRNIKCHKYTLLLCKRKVNLKSILGVTTNISNISTM